MVSLLRVELRIEASIAYANVCTYTSSDVPVSDEPCDANLHVHLLRPHHLEVLLPFGVPHFPFLHPIRSNPLHGPFEASPASLRSHVVCLRGPLFFSSDDGPQGTLQENAEPFLPPRRERSKCRILSSTRREGFIHWPIRHRLPDATRTHKVASLRGTYNGRRTGITQRAYIPLPFSFSFHFSFILRSAHGNIRHTPELQCRYFSFFICRYR